MKIWNTINHSLCTTVTKVKVLFLYSCITPLQHRARPHFLCLCFALWDYINSLTIPCFTSLQKELGQSRKTEPLILKISCVFFKTSEIMKLKPLVSLFSDIAFADGSKGWDLLLTAMLPFCQAMMEKIFLACRAVSEQSYFYLYPSTSDSSQANHFSWQLMDFYYIFSEQSLFQIPASLSCLNGPILPPAPALSNIG